MMEFNGRIRQLDPELLLGRFAKMPHIIVGWYTGSL